MERIYSQSGITPYELGVYFIRGDNVAVIGEIDTKLEENIDYTNVRAPPIKPMQIH